MSPGPGKPAVLVIDDDVLIRRLLRSILEKAGYNVTEADTGQRGLDEVRQHRPDLVILELRLPDFDGGEVLRRLRAWSQLPALILSAYSEESSKVAGLDAGADDYLTKPFGAAELLARLRALLRRTRTAETTAVVRFGPVEVDSERRRVTKRGMPVKLTAKEYALLQLLVTHRGKVVTHRQLLGELWGPKAMAQTHYLRVFMLRLRLKLEDEPAAPKYLQTESSVGYRLETDSPRPPTDRGTAD
ncbi:MAG: response regulator [Opitutales bacterium]